MGSSDRNPQVIHFADYILDLQTAELRRNGTKVILQDQPFQILTSLIEAEGRLVTREELIKRLWPSGTFVDFDQSLNRAVGRLREALGDSAEHPRFIETFPRKGYRWVSPIRERKVRHVGDQPTLISSTEHSLPYLTLEVEDPLPVQARQATKIRRFKLSFSAFATASWKVLVSMALVTIGTAGFLSFPERRPPLSEKDLVLVTGFQNRTNNPIFDATLKQALTIQLAQSPFLNIFPEDAVQETLRFMGREGSEELTPEVAREICERRGIKAMLTGSISRLGQNYVLALEAKNCRTGERLAQQQIEVQAPEQVLGGLEKVSSKLRSGLGESLSSIQKFDVSLEEATTSSLEALQAYSLAHQKLNRGGDTWEALPFLLHAVELDPDFAMAHAELGELYAPGSSFGNEKLSIQHLTKGFDLRNRTSAREKLYLTTTYYENAKRQLDEAIESYELWKWTYPRDSIPYSGLAQIYISTGDFEKAADNARKALALSPDRVILYERLAHIYVNLNRWNEAKEICQEAITRGLAGPRTHWKVYTIAFIEQDSPRMQAELEWAKNRHETTRVPFYQALIAAYEGKLRESRKFFQQTVDDRLGGNDKEGAALAAVQLALIEAHFGYADAARRRAISSVKDLPSSQDLAMLALGAAGDVTRSRGPLEELQRRFPEDTLLNGVTVPIILATIDLHQSNPHRALEHLRPSTPYELASDNSGRGLLAIYLKGQAYLRLHDGDKAVEEFQKIINHRGIDPISPLHPLALLGRARAYGLLNDNRKSSEAYRAFFEAWKNADADLPILKQAKAEYAKLHG